MDELLLEDGAMVALLDDESDELQQAMDEVIEDTGRDIDDIAEITDEDVENFDYDPEAESEYYKDIDTSDVGPDGETIEYPTEDDEEFDIEDVKNALLNDEEDY